MLLRRLLAVRKVDAGLPAEVKTALVDSLYAPFASLVVGAISGGVIGMMVWFRAEDAWLAACSVSIFVVGLGRIVGALAYRRRARPDSVDSVRRWERAYEIGAWAYSGLLGLLCFLSLLRSTDGALHLVVATTTAGYAAGITGRNAGRPLIAIGQLTFAALPLSVALLLYGDIIHFSLGVVLLLFVYGMTDITLSIRDIIVQALVSTREKGALASLYGEQANRFDAALNNMSHGLCMFDSRHRLLVWNERFIELSGLPRSVVKADASVRDLVRASVRNANHPGRSGSRVLVDMHKELRDSFTGQMLSSLGDGRTIALSRRMMAGGGSVVIFEDVTESKTAQERIERLAHFDDLTALPNRANLREQTEKALEARRVRDGLLAMHLIDLDQFKAVNDTLGHPLGDRLLRAVADRLREVVLGAGIVARFGGDEFVVLQSPRRREDVGQLASRIVDALAVPFEISGHRVDIGASLGIAVAPADGLDGDSLLKHADMALYAAKAAGRGVFRFFETEMACAAQARRDVELDLRKALAEQQFEVFYQPLVSLHTDQICGCEALLRWHHPELGTISPATFIPIAEDTGLIVPLGKWVLEQACAEASAWPSDIRVAINLSPAQFKDRTLIPTVAQALAKSRLPASRLELEITETVLMQDTPLTQEIIAALNQLGVRMSLDDFGTGYSSLSYLRRFPFQKIKIDGSFVKDLGHDEGSGAIVRAVASLGRELGMAIVAEGVETADQLTRVRAAGCNEAQGYLFGRPMTAAAIRERLFAGRGTQKAA